MFTFNLKQTKKQNARHHIQSAVCLFLIAVCVYKPLFAANKIQASPSGSWQTFDELTKAPRSIVQITENNKVLTGKIIKVYYKKNEGPDDRCSKCSGIQKNQLILGMTILWGMHKINPSEWSQGYILDPENGKVYHCQIRLSPSGQQLSVRGYIGLPLFGRTQTWQRFQ